MNPAIIRLGIETLETSIIKRSSSLKIDKGYLSRPEVIHFPTSNNSKSYGFLYMPKNKDFFSSKKDKPPLIVKSHGGPTSCAKTSLLLEVQYWTSRGFAVVDVNYRGSSGYGRKYRQLLNGNWGVLDVAVKEVSATHQN